MSHRIFSSLSVSTIFRMKLISPQLSNIPSNYPKCNSMLDLALLKFPLMPKSSIIQIICPVIVLPRYILIKHKFKSKEMVSINLHDFIFILERSSRFFYAINKIAEIPSNHIY